MPSTRIPFRPIAAGAVGFILLAFGISVLNSHSGPVVDRWAQQGAVLGAGLAGIASLPVPTLRRWWVILIASVIAGAVFLFLRVAAAGHPIDAEILTIGFAMPVFYSPFYVAGTRLLIYGLVGAQPTVGRHQRVHKG